jgi:leader peptidase (prepilin peptidase)/N-methyltransferase
MDNLPSYFIGFAVFLLGMIIGSFLNVVIYRLPAGESVVFPGSHCTACGAAIKPYDNIPVVSYALLRGRCRNCAAGISPVYPAVELLVGMLYLMAFLKDGLSPSLAADIIFISLVVPLVFIDLRHKILPDAITYPGLAAILILRALAPDEAAVAAARATWGLADWPGWAIALGGSALGAAVGGGSLWLVRELYYRLRHVEGMGLGDVKMMLMVGAFLGWQLTLLTIFLASLLGSLVGVALIYARGGSMRMEIPFGVFLGPAAIISLFVGQPLISWYLGFYK